MKAASAGGQTTINGAPATATEAGSVSGDNFQNMGTWFRTLMADTTSIGLEIQRFTLRFGFANQMLFGVERLLVVGLVNPDAVANHQEQTVQGLRTRAMLATLDGTLLAATSDVPLPADVLGRPTQVRLDGGSACP